MISHGLICSLDVMCSYRLIDLFMPLISCTTDVTPNVCLDCNGSLTHKPPRQRTIQRREDRISWQISNDIMKSQICLRKEPGISYGLFILRQHDGQLFDLLLGCVGGSISCQPALK